MLYLPKTRHIRSTPITKSGYRNKKKIFWNSSFIRKWQKIINKLFSLSLFSLWVFFYCIFIHYSPSLCLSVCLSVCLFLSLSLSLSIYIYIYIYIHIYMCVCVCVIFFLLVQREESNYYKRNRSASEFGILDFYFYFLGRAKQQKIKI